MEVYNCPKGSLLLFIDCCSSLQGGSIFSPSLLQTGSASRQQALQLATELGCVTSDPTDDDKMVSCLRATPVHQLNAAQTKVPPLPEFFKGTSDPICLNLCVTCVGLSCVCSCWQSVVPSSPGLQSIRPFLHPLSSELTSCWGRPTTTG